MRLINKIIKILINFKYKREPFMAWCWGIDEVNEINIITAEYYQDHYRFGTREEYYKTEKLINADYLTGRIFTEADLTNAHTCYESIMAIIESMELDDALDKIRTEIMDINVVRDKYSQRQNDYCDGVEFAKRYVLQIIDKYKASPTGAESEG